MASTLPQHLQIINLSNHHAENVSLERFPILPTELRLGIWKSSLQQHRLLEVAVVPNLTMQRPHRVLRRFSHTRE